MPDVTIGCDPEFLLLNNDNMVTHFDLNHNGPHGIVGCDHGGSVGELRPTFGNPLQVTEHIRELFRYIKTQRPNFKVVAGGGEKYGNSIGGHIHFGNINFQSTYMSPTRQRNRGRVRPLTLNAANAEHKLVWMLDYFIGRRLKKVPGGQRPKSSNYGRLSDIETKRWGFEYRTPPSWLSDPILTESTLAISYRIAAIWKVNSAFFDDILNKRKSIARKKEYSMLIPDSGQEKEYMTKQISNFKRIAFSKSYQMDNDNCLDTWLSSATAVIDSTTGRRINKIQLQICQLKLIQQDGELASETVVKVCRFAVPEIKIMAYRQAAFFSTFDRGRFLRLKDNTVYISKNLRPYLKVKRGHDCRVKFAEIPDNSVIYRAENANIINEVIRIFETGARKKLRNGLQPVQA